MKALLSAEGRAALATMMSGRPLLAFDFDGTLAPIVARPDEARVPLPVSRRLARLAKRVPLAVITGRAVDDVMPRLGFEAHFVIGNHGIEDPTIGLGGRWVDSLDPLREILQSRRQELASAHVVVEDKRHSIALHYRLAPDQSLARRCIRALLAKGAGDVEVQPGKCVVNVMAATAPDKGDALLSLAQRGGADGGLFIGDDVNDEAAFDKAPEGWVTARIGPPRARTHAAYHLESTSQLPTVLQYLLDASTPGASVDAEAARRRT
jgi:trehalose 6-phosphate phosphatase